MIPPTSTETTIETRANNPVCVGKAAAAKATSNEAIPPQPLKSATNCGMAVMAAFWATKTPSRLPATAPAKSQGQPCRPCWSSNPSTAMARARAAKRLAARAERTLPSPLMPRASSKTAARSRGAWVRGNQLRSLKELMLIIGRCDGGTWQAFGRLLKIHQPR